MVIAAASENPKTLAAARYAVSAFFFVDGAALGGYITHFRDIEIFLRVDHDVLGRCLIAGGLGAFIFMPAAGTIIHRFGSRKVCLISSLLLCFIIPFLMLAPSLIGFASTLFLVGVSNGQLDVSMNAHSVAVQNRFDKPIMSAVHGWFSLGGFAGAAGSALAFSVGLSPFQHLVVASLVLALLSVGAFFYMLPSSVDKDAEGPKFAWPRGTLLALGSLVILAFVAEGGIWDWASVYIRASLQASEQLGALGFGLFSLGMATSRFFGDAFVHKRGPAWVIVTSGILGMLGTTLGLAIPNAYVACLGFFIAGVGIANMVPIFFASAGNQPGISASVGLSAVATCGYTAFFCGPPIIGFVAKSISLRGALLLLAVLNLLVAVIGPKCTEHLAPSRIG